MYRFFYSYFLVIVLMFSFVSCKKKEEKEKVVRPVRALKLESKLEVQARTFPGRTRAVRRVNLSFRVDGPMIDRPVFVGDEVKKGQMIARIDPQDYEVKLQNVSGRLETAKARLRFAERDYERAVNIWKKDPGAISQSALDRKKEDVNELKGEIQSISAEVEAAEDQLDYTKLYAPFDGIIVATFVERYEYVRAKQDIVRILDNSQVEMVIDFPERMMPELSKVQDIVVSFESYPAQEFPASIKEIGTEASATTRTFPITLLIKQPKDIPVLSGMAGYARFLGEKTSELSKTGYLVPTTAIFSEGDLDKSYVWLIDPKTMTVSLQEVQKGELTDRGILITRGLEVGDWVVTAGIYSLEVGQEVTILPVKLNDQGEQIEIYQRAIEMDVG